MWWCLFAFNALTGISNIFLSFCSPFLGTEGKHFRLFPSFCKFAPPSPSPLLYISTFLRHMGFDVIDGLN